ncbi:hypothetical protein ASPTUDRAFT_672962 [Aspergillus tubingensis CBS 134.48]|uniref:Ig-like domain-containing protein n=1 Tax=Aspergillus tubingensis (strain CBS 134.48) TaxID=767770 RepID=A0A1L9MZK7_ASPTC|nr:hypothetical protein ASPTUDRAFT_672962 [Aspergillus tubingensis CBS 134.48]
MVMRCSAAPASTSRLTAAWNRNIQSDCLSNTSLRSHPGNIHNNTTTSLVFPIMKSGGFYCRLIALPSIIRFDPVIRLVHLPRRMNRIHQGHFIPLWLHDRHPHPAWKTPNDGRGASETCMQRAVSLPSPPFSPQSSQPQRRPAPAFDQLIVTWAGSGLSLNGEN